MTRTTDPLDDLLARSAPMTHPARPDEVAAMIAAARAERKPRTRRRRLALTGGVLALVLTGGAGVAVATDGFTWGPWLSDPVGSYALTLPSGLDCTVRVAHYTSASDPSVADEVNRIVEEWWTSSDVAAAAQPLVPEMIERIRSSENMVYIAETGETVPGGFGTEWYDADREYADAFAHAVGEVEYAVLEDHGIGADDRGAARLEGGHAIQCLDENGAVTIP